ncbi:MAG: TetR/AcrR family transcriptional regulator [Flavobacteriaceae bacterium]|nr:TetR/AcrR family transcriptional regulator [Flavobacteriaceae bacterium]MCB0475424.1 TetR/AcrR family transcriptional regulator [Flavobacteriaceae bacterium]
MTQEIKRKLTRQTMIDKGYELINTYGYHAVSVDRIIDDADLTKGAFYYHFKDKHHFVETIIQERVSKEIHSNFIEPLNERGNPLFILSDLMHEKLLKDKSLDQNLGCPLINFINDLSHEPNEYKLQAQLKEIFDDWKIALINFLYRGIEGLYLNRHIDTEATAEFIIASFEGIRTLKKVTPNNGIFYNYIQQLKNYLDTLKIPKEEAEAQRYHLADN